MKERQKHVEAFERYHAMGPSRSLARLAVESEVSESALKTWSREFRWAERLEERSRQVAETLAKETASNEVDERKQDQQMVRLGLVQVAKALYEGRIRPTMSDLDRLLRLKRELAEEVRERQDLTFTVTWPSAVDSEDRPTIDEVRDGLRREVERLEDEGLAG